VRGQDDRGQELQGRVALLGAVDLFRTLSQERIEQLAIATVTIRFAAGATIVSEGDDADYFYVVAEGEVELIRSTAPAEVRSAREHFGELASGDEVRHHAGAVTQTAASVYALDRHQVAAAIMSDAHP
jgi:CRP-like cAMP-binding protein